MDEQPSTFKFSEFIGIEIAKAGILISKSSTVAAFCKKVAYLVLAAKELEVDVDSLVRQVLVLGGK